MAELSLWLAAAIEAARRGAVELEAWRAKFQVREKGKADLVTNADLAAQQAIQSYLHDCFPDHDFLGEETEGALRAPAADARPLWIVDPLDGTTNYVHDCPPYCVSIGLLVAGEMVVGVVYDPRSEEMFSASQGHGAFLNGKPIRVSATAELSGALLASGFSADLAKHEDQLEWWKHFATRAQSLRRSGSSAHNLAYLACGRFDGFWALRNYPWDIAGGIVLVREAGGNVSQLLAATHDPFLPDILASNGLLHARLQAEFGA